MSPDWSGSPGAAIYSDLNDPETLNLYVYLGDNPLGGRDVTGHHQVCDADTSFVDQKGNLHVVAGKCHDVPDFFYPLLVAAFGHHGFPRAISKTLDLSSKMPAPVSQPTVHHWEALRPPRLRCSPSGLQ